MSVRLRRGFALAAFIAAVVGVPTVLRAQQSPAANASEVAKLKNPVAANAASVAAGKKLYDAQCASCHGATGKGDGKGGALLKPKPSDLTDSAWTHGGSDGEIFAVIRNGIKQTGMTAFGSRITTQEIWNLVNYVRTLSPRANRSQ
jgi:mono/diheme cytochrome c family protein